MDEPGAVPPLRVRQSVATRFDKCPLSAKFSVEEPEFDTHEQARGTIMHEFAARVVAECVSLGEPQYPEEMAKDLMAEIIRELALPLSLAENDYLMGLAWQFVTGRRINVDSVIGVEEDYEAEIIPGVVLTGRVDLVEIKDRVAVIRDYKTSWRLMTQAEAAGCFQRRCYTWLVRERYRHLKQVVWVLDNLRWQTERVVETGPSQWHDDETALRSLAARFKHAYEQDDWKPSPGSWCATCSQAEKCPIPNTFRRDGAIDSPETAEQYASEIIVADKIRKNQMGALKAWVAENGTLRVGDYEFGFGDPTEKAKPLFKARKSSDS